MKSILKYFKKYKYFRSTVVPQSINVLKIKVKVFADR